MTYFGDNKTPEQEFLTKKGNKILQKYFEMLKNPETQKIIPPFFIFIKHSTENSTRSVQFKGVAFPGHSKFSLSQNLITVLKKNTEGKSFQNYEARFSILNIDFVSREWINDISSGNKNTKNSPDAWKNRFI